ncbi:hypothetical protein [Alkalibacillus salilacus]|uniref:Uncharacterized protein n=1 Tax=Alkalibacillus salilacus TaxID=284582 RepID=A0ABT9VDE9_9BACI|nr:hypothetical protein [Alkalibacillus salilacus]MDQ0158973.1 hypothetical protein [Alkalibacillus salilacus]
MSEKNKLEQIGDSMQNAGKEMQGAGNNMMGCGCLLTILITIPILLLLFL